jgi:hypothetical protein
VRLSSIRNLDRRSVLECSSRFDGFFFTNTGKFQCISLLEPVRRPLEKPATTTESESDMQTQENPKFDLKMEKVI